MKRFIVASAVILLSFVPTPVVANQPTSVVVIDSGFDVKLINNVVAEVCIIDRRTGCNNGTGFDESAGAAQTSRTILPNHRSEWNHGSIMANVINQINPQANLILIRSAFITAGGGVGMGGEDEFALSLKWVIANKDKYNISAVSFSRGRNNYNKQAGCPVNRSLQQDIVSLQKIGVPTIIAAGNSRDKVHLNYPACIPEAVAISGIFSQTYTPKVFSSYRETNGTSSGPLTDFFAYGNFDTRAGKIAESTSSSTAAFAGYWSKVSNGSYLDTYNRIASQTSNKFVNVLQ